MTLLERLRDAFLAPTDEDEYRAQQGTPLALMRGAFWALVLSSPVWILVVWWLRR
jgi:hypothetical protein